MKGMGWGSIKDDNPEFIKIGDKVFLFPLSVRSCGFGILGFCGEGCLPCDCMVMLMEEGWNNEMLVNLYHYHTKCTIFIKEQMVDE